MSPKEPLDEVAWRLIEALQEDARLPYAELGRRVGLSAPAVAERLRRLEEAGVITGYGVRLDRARLGYGLTAFVRLKVRRPRFAEVAALARELPVVLECHQVAGEDSFILKVVAVSVRHLDALLLRFAPFGPTASAVVLATEVADKPLARPRPGGAEPAS